MDFQDQKTAPPKASKEQVARNPNNANILKGGQVDPRSQLYQRSIAGREQLKDYLSRLSSSGADEADIFMAGVTSLMKRGHGYVGAYLDSKNPGRRYEKNQAMAITDKVMTDEGIGENPGARLTRPKVEDEEGNIDKEATKEARDKRKEANAGRGSGPQQAPGPSAKPVGQQRKEGKRESTGQPLEDSRRDTKIGKPGEGPIYQPVSKKDGSGSVDVERKWQQEMEAGFRKIKLALKDGSITPEEAKSQISELNSRSKEFVTRGKQEREQGLKDDAAVYKRREDRKKQRDGGQPPAGGAQPPAQPPTGEGQPPAADAEVDEKTANAPEGGSAKRVEVDNFTKNSVIKKNVIDFLNGRSRLDAGKELEGYITDVSGGWEGDPEILGNMLDDLSNEISDSYKEETDINLDPDSIKDSILGIIRSNEDVAKKFGASLESIQSTPQSAPGGQESTGPAPTAASQPKAAPDRQTQATDETVLSRATQLDGRTAQAAPQEQPAPATAAQKSPTPRSPLNQIAKTILAGIARDKAARGSAGQFFKLVRDLVKQQVGEGAPGSDIDQAAATAINQQKARTTRNKASVSAPGAVAPEKKPGLRPGPSPKGSGSVSQRTGDPGPTPSKGSDIASAMKELTDSGLSTAQARAKLIKDKVIKPRPAKKSRGKTFSSAEYQEFAQSVRSMMR